MTQTARVKLTSISLPKLDTVCNEIMGIGKKTGVKVKGPNPTSCKKITCRYKKVSLW